ncbi:hypothetical protein NKG94_16780 [Micromonospora sp. M12]
MQNPSSDTSQVVTPPHLIDKPFNPLDLFLGIAPNAYEGIHAQSQERPCAACEHQNGATVEPAAIFTTSLVNLTEIVRSVSNYAIERRRHICTLKVDPTAARKQVSLSVQ